MKIEVFAICWNEIELVPYFVRHYKTFASRITVFDNYSSDGSDIALSKLGCEVIKYGGRELDDREYLRIKNNAWKDSKADYVIVCDMDELLYHPNIKSYLHSSFLNGVNIFETQGIDMFSNNMPAMGNGQIYEFIKTGFESPAYSKRVIFSPSIENINYDYGCHHSQPTGNLIFDSSRELKVLHYRNIGGSQRLLKRHKAYQQRMCHYNKRMGLGKHYLRSDKQIISDFEGSLRRSTPQW
jgi:hypothetical protein